MTIKREYKATALIAKRLGKKKARLIEEN